MPKKRTGKALLIKPGSQSTIASSSGHATQHESTPSVNDLIRESRRMQFRDQSVSSTPQVLNSLPPQVRQVLNLPQPEPPRPRQHGARATRPTPVASSECGPSRSRTVPGPPPPRSWLTGSRHAPPSLEGRYQSLRILDGTTSLPGGSFPRPGSLQDYALKELAVNWQWHAENTHHSYFATIPAPFREALLSYIAAYRDTTTPACNPLRVLFLHDDSHAEIFPEVTRLDLDRGIGNWTQLKSLDRDLLRALPANASDPDSQSDIPESWDQELPSVPLLQSHNPFSRILVFPNLRHLSLALNPLTSTTPPSWKSLLQLADHLSALRSLSLAHWPLPTYTPRAATTRATVSAGGLPPVVFGGTNMYTTMDESWVEAPGILRSLSRKMPSLTWLDLSGCGAWWDALMWRQMGLDERMTSIFAPDEPPAANFGPEWNGAWRAVMTLVLKVGWQPAAPVEENEESAVEADEEYVRLGKKAAYIADQGEYEKLKLRQKNVVDGLRVVRRHAQGAWVNVVT